MAKMLTYVILMIEPPMRYFDMMIAVMMMMMDMTLMMMLMMSVSNVIMSIVECCARFRGWCEMYR